MFRSYLKRSSGGTPTYVTLYVDRWSDNGPSNPACAGLEASENLCYGFVGTEFRQDVLAWVDDLYCVFGVFTYGSLHINCSCIVPGTAVVRRFSRTKGHKGTARLSYDYRKLACLSCY